MKSNILTGITRPGNSPFKNPGPHGTPTLANRMRMRVVGPDGEVKQETPWVENIMTTFGLASIASRIGTAATNNVAACTTELISAIKIGTGTTAATSTDTSLVASTGSVTYGNASFTKSNLGNMTAEFQATFASNNPAGAATITEVGLFCNSTADSQAACRSVLSGASSVNKGASDIIQVSYDWILKTA